MSSSVILIIVGLGLCGLFGACFARYSVKTGVDIGGTRYIKDVSSGRLIFYILLVVAGTMLATEGFRTL